MMTKQILLLTVALLLANVLLADEIPGKIIIDEHTTISAILKVPMNAITKEPNYEKLQFKITYYDSLGNKFKMKPDEAQEVQFTVGSENIRLLSRYNTIGLDNGSSSGSKVFLRLKTDGKLKLFYYYATQSIPGSYSTETGSMTGSTTYGDESYVFQKGEGLVKKPSGLSFRKDMAEYFSDCPELAQKIENKEYKYQDLEAIVQFYNSSCK